MALNDPIADYLTRIRNAQQAGHRIVEIPSSNMKKGITEILYDNGYILKYMFDDAAGKQGVIKIALKYNESTKKPVIQQLKRVSRPGLRQYFHCVDLPRVINGLGIAIVSTSHGLLTDKQARSQNVGGEVVCFIS
ncbi:MAG: 30S ribosomal protein S8 [Saprospiraceae bacterium]|jgi:small subunit ribosomal protein S8|uniref:30S ribosomal protein S8 n=1 Tax=Candidatus Brachybacter algidus TaxID=2982024 RepID=UPI001B4F7F61|nr:30S ribosomal protein S8 [Candidatus Brachybacter algidus]MBP7304928.1 30S ribosomal protein S8 [Saprospiraceae bacterium]MBK6374711.1 30S ribosomal protein S8 [Candidatus Brachybacter algidus]MBK6449748.1 30S ribosomal protein S8 [Candidatus Brachybacter algidus]MBK7604364.1 30S ribosomal protein S8 [Candidatus Brachybacter algidus]MBK8355467.1 30S ribosomal protein S8 [Candidatus Brachybacter algidus]